MFTTENIVLVSVFYVVFVFVISSFYKIAKARDLSDKLDEVFDRLPLYSIIIKDSLGGEVVTLSVLPEIFNGKVISSKEKGRLLVKEIWDTGIIDMPEKDIFMMVRPGTIELERQEGKESELFSVDLDLAS